MKDFGEFNIRLETEGFVGDKISINQVLNLPVVIEKYKTGPSKFENKSTRLDMQLLVNSKRRVLFISSKSLIEMIEKVPKNGFPFRAKIIQDESGRMIFTNPA